jgi:hypothetical protein
VLDVTPTDVASVVTVDELRASRHLPPDPVDGLLKLPAYKAKYATTIAEGAAAETGALAPTATPAPGGPPGFADHETTDGWLLAAKEAAAVNGTPDDVVSEGTAAGAPLTAAWAAEMAKAVEGLEDPQEIQAAITKAGKALPLKALAKSIERNILRGLMLGALDSAWEIDHERDIATTLAGKVSGVAGFATKPYDEAVADFAKRKIVGKRAFDRMTAEAKRRSFTVAGLARNEMVAVAHEELATALAVGRPLSEFSSSLSERFDAAGWTEINPSHVELIYRNGVAKSYAQGRRDHLSQPHILAARPYWEIKGIDDENTRPAHGAAHGKILSAEDPFWDRAPLPWGHNDRCRIVSRTAAYVERSGLEVTDGDELEDLPDEGWDG